MNRSVLLTGFETFAEYPLNSSWEVAVKAAAGLPSYVHIKRLPVDFFAAKNLLTAELDGRKPSICLSLGMGSEGAIYIERLACKPHHFITTLSNQILYGFWPWRELAAALSESGQPVYFSEDAGKYVCESTYWSLLEYRVLTGIPILATLVHIPPVKDEYLIDRIARAVCRAITKRILSLYGNI